MANTTNYALTKPTVGGDADVWGGYLNNNSDAADALIAARTPGFLNGLTLSNNGTDATNDIDIAAGKAAESGGVVVMALASALTKRLDADWQAGTNNGMRYSGAAIANTTYGIWLVATAAGTVDVYAYPNSGAPSAATVLAALQAETGGSSYAYVRRIGCILRESSAIVGFTQKGDEFLRKVPVRDIDAGNPGTSAVTRTLSVPIGVQIIAKISARMSDATPSAAGYYLLTSLDQTDTAVSASVYSGGYHSNGGAPAAATGEHHVRTNTSAQIRSRLNQTDTDIGISIMTHGWIDTRGRLG